ncbi:MAG: hypothetical protein IKP10_01920 [Clostridia bacterium]|nr:hypothetical protein [Clostridia bacterium]
MKKLLAGKRGLLIVIAVLAVAAAAVLTVTGFSAPAARYGAAERLMAGGNHAAAADAFDALGTYADASRMAMYCRAVDAGENGRYTEARDAFTVLGDFRDSSLMALYYLARGHQENGTPPSLTDASDSALVNAKSHLGTAFDLYASMKLFRDSRIRMADCGGLISGIENEQTARVEAQKKAEEEARKKAEEKAEQEVRKRIASEEKLRNVGSYVTFGAYPQTAEGTDSTPIEWLVLDYDAANNRALLISRYGLDAKPCNEKRGDYTWERCSLRSWLNRDFLNAAFSQAEQSVILLTNVDNSRSQGYSEYGTNGGNNTQDRIFLLSYAEANKYLGVTYFDRENMKSRAAPTDYAIKQGAHTDDNKTADGVAAGFWRLRSPGMAQGSTAVVAEDGHIANSYVDSGWGCVRPALWINLESDIF